MNTEQIKNKFEELIGYENVQYIESNNWVKYDIKPFDIYKVNDIEICFLERDNLGDKVIYHTICYNLDDKVWISENCIDSPEIQHKTFSEMKKHIDSIEDKVRHNGFSLIDLPNVL